MGNRNVDKGREAENAVARVLREAGMPGAERRSKRGGYVELPDGSVVPADAGDITGIPGVVVQVKWSGYKSLDHDLMRTEQQRQVAGAAVGLLVRKRKGVGCPRAAEWDAYLPLWQLVELVDGERVPELDRRPLHTDLWTAARLVAARGYGAPAASLVAAAPSSSPF